MRRDYLLRGAMVGLVGGLAAVVNTGCTALIINAVKNHESRNEPSPEKIPSLESLQAESRNNTTDYSEKPETTYEQNLGQAYKGNSQNE